MKTSRPVLVLRLASRLISAAKTTLVGSVVIVVSLIVSRTIGSHSRYESAAREPSASPPVFNGIDRRTLLEREIDWYSWRIPYETDHFISRLDRLDFSIERGLFSHQPNGEWMRVPPGGQKPRLGLQAMVCRQIQNEGASHSRTMVGLSVSGVVVAGLLLLLRFSPPGRLSEAWFAASSNLGLLRSFRWFCRGETRASLDLIFGDLKKDRRRMRAEGRGEVFISIALGWHSIASIASVIWDGLWRLAQALSPLARLRAMFRIPDR